MRGAIAILSLVLSLLALPGAALAQSAGDEQYTDPFSEEQPATQEEAEPAPEPPASEPAPAEGGNGTAEAAPTADAAQEGAPALPRTGAPVVLFAAAGYALLLAGVVLRRKA